MSKLLRTHNKSLESFALSTTIASAWNPAAGRRVRLMGASVKESAGTAVTVAVTNGTAVASGTLGHFELGANESREIDWGDKGLYADLDAKIGLKVLANTSEITGTLSGREEGF